MAFRIQKKAVCFFAVFVLFWAGVCSGMLEADSSFLYDTSASSNQSLKACANLLEEELCTSEMLGHLETVREIKSKKNSELKDRTVRSRTECGLAGSDADLMASVSRSVLQKIYKKANGNTVIIYYIHNQDGKKK